MKERTHSIPVAAGHELPGPAKRNGDFSPMIRRNPIDGFQASLLIKLEKLDWGSILDNKSDGHAE